jgi:hypothetical protein
VSISAGARVASPSPSRSPSYDDDPVNAYDDDNDGGFQSEMR